MKKIREEFADTMLEVGLKDPKLVVMVGDISHGILQKFNQNCPGRYYNIGICEPSMVSMAAGIYKSGLIPVVHTIAPFIIERAYEQIKLDFGYQQYGVNLVAVGNAFDYSQLGCSHHCYADISLMKHFKRSNIFFPASPKEFNVLFKKSYNNGQINYFRIPEHSHGIAFDEDQLRIGKGIRVKEGKDFTILAIGYHLKTALQAREILLSKNISAEILYYPCIKPFDKKLVIESVLKTKNILVIEEVSSSDGVFNYVLDATKHISKINYSHIAIDDFIHDYGSYEELCKKLGFTAEALINKMYNDFSFLKEKSLQEVNMSSSTN